MAADILGAGLDREVDAFLEARGNRAGVAQVLSMSTTAPPAWAAAAIAGTSCISKESEPGDSTKTARVFGCISAAMPPPISGS